MHEVAKYDEKCTNKSHECSSSIHSRELFMFLLLVCERHQAAAARAELIAESRPSCCQYRLPTSLLPHPRMSTTDDISTKLTWVFPRTDLSVDLVEVALVSERASGNRSRSLLLRSLSCSRRRRIRNRSWC